MDKNDILKALKSKVYYAELPSKMDVCLNNNSLHNTYTQGLKDVSKFIVIAPKQLMSPIKDTHPDLYNYLDTRYWQ